MSRRILIVLGIILLVLAPTAIATATAPSASVVSAQRATSSMSLAAASGQTVETRIESVRHSQDGTRVADFAAGAYKGKNVIIIQVESLNGLLLGKKYEGRRDHAEPEQAHQRELVLAQRVLGDRGWATPSTPSSSPTRRCTPRKGQATAVKYANRVDPAMPRVLEGLGYYTFTMHTNNVMYWNRRQTVPGARLHPLVRSPPSKGMPMDGRVRRLGRGDLFKRGAKVLRGFEASGTPVYGQIITVSAHEPFIGIPSRGGR
jgi:lipoteichoic acid synthase